MGNYHALLSPSGADKWINCANALTAEKNQPDVRDNSASIMGTDKHELLALCLESSSSAENYLGQTMGLGSVVTHAFASSVQIVIDNVKEEIYLYGTQGATVKLKIETAVPIGFITGETDATGTADIILIATWYNGRAEICVIDAKFGYKEVSAEMNPQMMMYALGAWQMYMYECDPQTFVLAIAQPAISEELSRFSIDADDLEKWAEKVAVPAASKALSVYTLNKMLPEEFNPGTKQCQWCKASAVCVASANRIQEIIGADFDRIEEAVTPDELTNDKLGDIWSTLDFMENWTKAVRGRIEYELMQGNAVKGTKLVEGRRGNRGWDDDEEAEKVLKSFRLKHAEMYSSKLLGPKAMLEVLKNQPRRIKRIEMLVTQKAGKPHVAHVSDRRTALEIKPVDSDFEAVDDNFDLI